MRAINVVVLGPLQVWADDAHVTIGASKARAVVSLLALRAGTAVGARTLIDGLWGDDPPRSARKLIQMYVSEVRRALPPGQIVTVPDGYRLEVGRDQVDAWVFCAGAAAGRKLTAEDPLAAATMLRDALSLWRGPAVVDLVDHPLGQAEAASLDETRRNCEEDLGAARLAAGDHTAAIADLAAAAMLEPLRERRWAQLMVALYRSGRQVDALRAYERVRRLLVEQVGLEPGAVLRELADAILLQKPELDLPDGRAGNGAGLDRTGAGGLRFTGADSTALGQRDLRIESESTLSDPVPCRLQDLGSPERSLRSRARSLEVDSPLVRSLDNAELNGNLPRYLSTFIGRVSELDEVRALIESSRLVTLTGTAGSGKTRLAIEVAAELLDGSRDGVWFADLASVAESGQVPGAVSAALGIRQRAGPSPLEVLLDVLRGQNVLLILDNCEHVIDACAKLSDLVNRGCPRVHLVTTSREPLGIDGERVHRVGPLSLPPEEAGTVDDLEGSDAVKLFLDRARAHDDTFILEDSIAGLVASICRRLDGTPFALELAAARLATMSLAHLNERLDQRFRLLRGGSRNALARQQTLQATVDWSFDLLDQAEQQALCRLSVFVGGFELEAAESVCVAGRNEALNAADLLASLVNKSLVVAQRTAGSVRYGLLETIRQYAADKLEAGGTVQEAEAREAHADFYLQFSEAAGPELTGPRQGQWLRRLDLERDNLRATFAYLAGQPNRTEEILRLGVALYRFLRTRGQIEPVEHLRAALDRPEAVSGALRARALSVTGHLVSILLGVEDPLERRVAHDLVERALGLARDLGDRVLEAEALRLCAGAAFPEHPRRATMLAEESVEVARSAGDPGSISYALYVLHDLVPMPERKRELLVEALAYARQAGDTFQVSNELWQLAIIEGNAGQLEAGRSHLEEAISAAEEIGFEWALPGLWYLLGLYCFQESEFEEAARLGRKALVAGRKRGFSRLMCAFSIFLLACCAAGRGDYLRAAQLTGAYEIADAAISDADPKALYWSPKEQQMRDDNRARLRRVLSDDEFERACAAGAALSLEQAVDLALGRARPT